MSESSFDTSVANTAASVTSALSLGQCIKQTAEESQGNQWFELQPTFEKEWNTLQGEPSSQMTVSGNMNELPINVTTRQSVTGSTNPMIQLLGQNNFERGSNLPEETGDEAESSTIPKSALLDKSKDLHVTANLEPQKSNAEKLNSNPEDYSRIVEEPLTMEQLSNILEKDDSLAQRVQDLLDDEYEVKSCEDLDRVTINSNTDSEYLIDPPENASMSKPDIHDQDSTFHTLGSVDKSDIVIQNVPEMLKQTLPPLETDMDKIISCLSRQSDPFGSLNTSKSTEYGDLPETVDIPPDIIRRLNNMRLLDKNNISPKEALVPPSTMAGTSIPSQHPSTLTEDRKVISEAPISGNVQYHFGSNPTTPQFPIDEENLKQLQTYIEKKTGEPTISPLVAGSVIPQGQVSSPSPLVDVDYLNRIAAASGLVKAGAVAPTQEHPKTSSVLSSVTVDTSAVNLLSHSNIVSVDCKNVKRSEPEGMSPPVVSTAGNLLGPVSSLAKYSEKKSLEAVKPITLQESSGLETPNMELTEHVANNESVTGNQTDEDSLADESILARIKCVLSESISRQQVGSSMCAPSYGVGRSDASFASSVDSLAMQVKALLQEEVDQQNENQEANQVNLSQVIENFEQTDLWKYVRQFLPSGGLNQETEVRKDEDVSESASDVSLNNTLLARIRAEFEKEKAALTPVLFTEEVCTGSSTAVPQTSQLQHNDVPNLSKQSKPTSIVESKATSIYSVGTQQSNRTYRPMHETAKTPQISHSVIQNTVRTEQSHSETIPGIPDFSRSVFSAVDEETKKLQSLHDGRETELGGGSSDFHVGNDAAPLNMFMDHKTSDNTHLTFDWKMENSKDQDIRISSFRTEDSASHHAAEHCGSLTKSQMLLPHNNEKSPRVQHFKEKGSEQRTNKKGDALCGVQESFETIPAHRFSSTPTKVGGDYSVQEFGFQPSGGVLSPPSQSYKHNLQPQRRHRKTPSPPRRTPKTSPAKKPYDKTRSPKKTLLQDRITVHGWLSSPERQQYKAMDKVLPTFDELMRKQEQEKKYHDNDGLDHIPTSDKKSSQKSVDTKPTDEQTNLRQKTIQSSTLEEPPRLVHPKEKTATTTRDSKLKVQNPTKDQQQQRSPLQQTGPPSSLCIEVEDNDSYQNLSATENQIPSVQYDSSALGSRLSDVDMHRRMLYQEASSDDRVVLKSSKSKTSLLSALDDFHTLDVNVQKQILKKLVELLQQKKQPDRKTQKVPTPSRDLFRPATSQPNLSVLHETSQNSNAAVCDSDSTEYCELPSSQQTTVVKEQNSVRNVLGVDESKAEQIMKRLLKKIEKQKLDESRKKGRKSDKRRVISSSTPEKKHAPLILPEASSIASTDTDASKTIRYVHVRRHAPLKKKKVTYVEEVSSSEPTIVKIKRKPKKSELVPKRVVLHDRSVQANVEEELSVMSHDIATNFPSPTPSKHKPRRSKQVQACVSTENKENDSLNDTITIHTPARKQQRSTKQGKKSQDGQRFSSFYVDFTKDQKKSEKPKEKIPIRESLAWYEPFQYQAPWMDTHKEKSDKEGLVRITLQEALSCNHPEFVSKSRERQRRITINAEERRLQEVWAEERQRVFGVKSENSKQSKSTSALPFKRRVELTRRQVIQETRDKYQQLPEVVKRKKEEERQREYATNRLKAQIYKKKIQNKVLGNLFAD